MERPDLIKPFSGLTKNARCVGRTNSIAEAESIMKQYEAQGYQAWITKRSQGGISLYEVWISKEPDILSVK